MRPASLLPTRMSARAPCTHLISAPLLPLAVRHTYRPSQKYSPKNTIGFSPLKASTPACCWTFAKSVTIAHKLRAAQGTTHVCSCGHSWLGSLHCFILEHRLVPRSFVRDPVNRKSGSLCRRVARPAGKQVPSRLYTQCMLACSRNRIHCRMVLLPIPAAGHPFPCP